MNVEPLVLGLVFTGSHLVLNTLVMGWASIQHYSTRLGLNNQLI